MAAGGLQGGAELRSSLQAAITELQSLTGSDAKAGEELATEVRAEAPKLTGYMAGTVEHAGATVTVGAPYARFVNARNPFTARAIAAAEQRVVDIYAEGVATAISRIHGT